MTKDIYRSTPLDYSDGSHYTALYYLILPIKRYLSSQQGISRSGELLIEASLHCLSVLTL